MNDWLYKLRSKYYTMNFRQLKVSLSIIEESYNKIKDRNYLTVLKMNRQHEIKYIKSLIRSIKFKKL